MWARRCLRKSAIKDSIIHDRDTVIEADLVRMLEERKLISGKLANHNSEPPNHDSGPPTDSAG